MLRREWKKLLSNKMMLIVVLAIIAIPTIYTTLFLGSMWDPYGNVDKLPVAVVNEDQPVTYEGETLDVGKQFKGRRFPGFPFYRCRYGQRRAGRRYLLYGYYHSREFFCQCGNADRRQTAENGIEL